MFSSVNVVLVPTAAITMVLSPVFKTGKFRNFADLADGLASAMAGMGSYIAMIFFMAQFMNYFDWSNLGLILAIKGAEVLKASGLPIWLVLVLFIIFIALLNIPVLSLIHI